MREDLEIRLKKEAAYRETEAIAARKKFEEYEKIKESQTHEDKAFVKQHYLNFLKKKGWFPKYLKSCKT